MVSVVGQELCDGVSPVEASTLERVLVAIPAVGRPLYVTQPPGDKDRIFILDQDGRIFLHKRGDAPSLVTEVLDITAVVEPQGFSTSELGLLGMAFDPDFDGVTNRAFYLNYTESEGGLFNATHATVVARYLMDAVDPDIADPDSEQRILRFAQPESNHNGGWIAFGQDGYLYIATGDGGGANDEHGACGNGQNTGTLHGNILRIDVRNIAPNPQPPECGILVANYDVPGDNPFVGQGGCDEIWAYGLRNPWRNSFDRANGDFYITDVGQQCREEVNWVSGASSGGENYGWRVMEGSRCFDPASPSDCDPAGVACGSSPPCRDPSLTDPVLDYLQTDFSPTACSVIGGYAYRGCRISNYQGHYFYGDYCNGFVKSFLMDGGVPTLHQDWAGLALGINNLTSFGEDTQGELYIVDRNREITKIVPPLTDFEVSGAGAAPFLLSKTADWTWEDLQYTSEHPISTYKVYRGLPNDLFSCIHQTPDTRWAGDPDDPSSGSLFAYVVTAVNSGGDETKSGNPVRDLSAAPCP